MIKAVLKMQGCNTKAGRRAFVQKAWGSHGIARGNVRFYEVTAPSWTAVRNAVASYDTSGKRTMGFSEVNAETVEFYIVSVGGNETGSRIRPLPVGTTKETAKKAVSWWPRIEAKVQHEECADCGSTGHDTGSDTCPGPDVQDRLEDPNRQVVR